MASPNNMLHPQDGYFPQAPQDTRRRSSSYTDRYRPRAYSNASQQQSGSPYLYPAQIPLPMSGQGTPLYQPPYPDDHNSQPRFDMPLVPARQLADEIPMRRSSEAAYPDGLRRPSYDTNVQLRRTSHDSRLSHHSHRSDKSHRSHRPREDDESDLDDDTTSHAHRHHEHHHGIEHDDRDAYRKRQKEKGNNVSRSFGDSLISVLSPLKYLLEPRDKY